MSAPDPLVPADVDLRGLEYMPYYGDRLRESGLNARATDAEYRAAHNLWWSAWKQVPAASLPNDDVELCKLADLHRDLKAWHTVKNGAMRGFVLCSDGRWYHRQLAEFALNAWAIRLNASARGANGAAKRWGKHKQEKPIAQAPPNDSASNAPAIEKHSKEVKGREEKRGLSTSPTRSGQLQNPLKKISDSTPSGLTPDESRELARRMAAGEDVLAAKR